MTKSTFSAICILFLSFILMHGKVNAQEKQYVKLCQDGAGYATTGSLDTAILKFDAAIALKPTESCAYIGRACVNCLKKKYDDAITDISQAIALKKHSYRLRPNSPYNYLIRGSCYLEKNIYSKAIDDYTTAITKLKSDDIQILKEAYYFRGVASLYDKQYESAANDFTKCIEFSKKLNTKDSYISISYARRAVCYENASKYSDAIKDYDLYLSLNPGHYWATFNQGVLYLKTGDTIKAKTNAKAYIVLNPAYEIYFKGNNILDIYDIEKRTKITKGLLKDAQLSIKEYKETTSKAIGDIKLADAFQSLDSAWFYFISLSSIKDSILKNLAIVYSKIKVKPEISELARKYMVQATAATEEDKYADAINLWDKGLLYAPYYPLAYYNRAMLKETMENYAGAITDMEKYIEFAPDASYARAAQDKIYEWEGKIKKTTDSVYYNSYWGFIINLLNKIIAF